MYDFHLRTAGKSTNGETRMADRITSNQNPLLRHIRKLQASRAYREECGEFVCDGFKLLDEALKWYPHLKTVIVAEGAQLPPLPPDVRAVEIPASLMQSLSSMKTPQGVIFTCSLPERGAPQICGGTLLLDRVQDPGNLGTILRTADAFGVPVLLTNGCADPYSEKTLRASMGAVLRTAPQSAELSEILNACKERGIRITATALSERATDLRQTQIGDDLVVIGSEGQGICRELLDASDRQVIIPMQPRCESLNAAVAAALVMWNMKY